MAIDLHNHTKLCNHAVGEIEEYIQTAIDTKTSIFGFSDHAPMTFDEGYRMTFNEMKKYEQDILEMKSKYAAKIDIKLGYEVDFLAEHIDKRVIEADVDYLIGSVHFLNKWGFDNPEFIGEYQNRNLDELWSEYFLAIKNLADSKLFDIVGHFDLLKIFNFLPNKDLVDLASPALEAIKKSGMALEINSAGLRKKINEQYPSIPLLQEVKKLEIPITFGSDAHAPSQVGQNRNRITQLARELGFEDVAVFEKRRMTMIKF